MNINVEQILDGMEGITYLMDRDGIVVSIGRPNWNKFAAANDGHHLLDGRGVIGNSIFEFIAGDAVVANYRKLFSGIIAGKYRGARLLSRCDSPAVERQLCIVVTPIHSNGSVERLLVQCLTVSEAMRPPMDLFDFQAERSRLGGNQKLPILAMCSYCQGVRFPIGSTDDNGEWITANEYYHRGGDSRVRISHGICPVCLDKSEEMLVA
jgi:hypothetical protein